MSEVLNLLKAANPFSKKGKVTVVANTELEGNPIITPRLHPDGSPKVDLEGNELGSMRLEQKSVGLTNGFMNTRSRTAFITAPIAHLEALVKENNLKAGSVVPGTIIQTESLAPMWEGQPAKSNPNTGEQVVINVQGKNYPVYMQQRYTDNEEAKDTLIRSENDVVAYLSAINPPVVETPATPQDN